MGLLPPTLDPVARMYRRVLTGWAQDTLASAGEPWWRGLDPLADYRDRDWKKLYAGSVLDD